MAPAKRPTFGLVSTITSLVFLLLAAAVSAGPARRDFESFAGPDFKRATQGDKYLIGVGKADITGPAVEIGFAGYADLDQKGSGLRQRLYSRAFVIGDVNNPEDRFIYIVLDALSGDTAMRYGILEALEALGGEYSVYGSHNIALTGTHAHSAPGAWFNYLTPQVTTFGFDKQSYQAIVDGAVLSIQRAQESLQEGYLDVSTAEVEGATINRSLYSYLHNPIEEQEKYGNSVDTKMTMMRFQRASDNKDIGLLTWHAIHATSMLGNNTHVAGDNKGLAAWMVESELGGTGNAAEGFVVAFGQANHADTSPNIGGAWCDDGSNKQCDFKSSTCSDGTVVDCHGRGPKFEALDLGISSCYDIAIRLATAAKVAYNSYGSKSTPIVGSTVKSYHFFHDMRFWEFTLPDGTPAQTCPAALGYSFAAGTSDWPGLFDFTQGDSGEPDANPLWAAVKGLLKNPTEEQKKCQGEKPVLLDIGEMETPYAWGPNIIDIQTLRVGQFVMVTSPSEVDTMAGRRWREAIAAEAETFLDEEPIVVVGSPANTYAHYVVTPEEYDVQRYEGASTLYGRHTLDAYINLTVSNLNYVAPGATGRPDPGPSAPDNRENSLDFITGVVKDGHPIKYDFGDVRTQPEASYSLGDIVKVTFQGANPRNNLRLEETYVAIERKDGDNWTRVRDDSDWFLVYTWRRTNGILGYSEVDVTWETAGNAGPGTYRVKYYGDWKAIGGKITAFEGTSGSFELS